MLIKNITDKSTPKVIGVGHVWLQPGEEKFVPDDGLFVAEVDKYGKATGKKVIINAIMNQVKLNMLEVKEDDAGREPEPVVEVQEVPAEIEEEKPVVKSTKRSTKSKAQ